jgi:acyl carrier protein
MVELKQVEVRLELILKDHYGMSGHELKENVLDKTVRDIDMDSLALLEFFLVVEEGFGLKATWLSSRVDMSEVLDLPMNEFVRMIAVEVFEVYRRLTAP